MSYGVRKVSVDDIVKNAGFAKGSFYQHFESKEQYLYRLIEKMHHDLFLVVEQMIRGRIVDEPNFAENVRDFLQKLFSMPELVFFIQNEQDISVIFEAASDGELQTGGKGVVRENPASIWH